MAGVTSLGPWRRSVTGSPGAATVQQWYIDEATGSDSNSGLTAGSALKTLDEYFARLGEQPIDGIVVTLNIMSDITYADGAKSAPIKARFKNGGELWIVGQRNVVATDTIAAVAAWSPTSGVVGSYTLTNTTTTSLVGAYVRISSGSNMSTKTPIVKSTGAKSFRGLWIDSVGNAVEPAVGDAVEIYYPTKIVGNVSIDSEGATGQGVLFQDLEIGTPGQNHSVACRTGAVTLYESIAHGYDVWKGASGSIIQSYVVEHRCYGAVQTWGSVFTSAGGDAFNARGGGVIAVYGHTLVQGYGMSAGHPLEGPGVIVSSTTFGAAPIAVVDYAVDAVTAYPNSSVVTQDRLFIRDAAAGGLTGYRAMAAGGILYASGMVPASTGTAPATFAKIGGTTKTSAQVPYTEATNCASFAVNQ